MFTSLWRRRTQAPMGSRRWAKLWAKRIYSFPALTAMLFRHAAQKASGVRFYGVCGCSRLELQGPASRLSVADGSFLGRVTIQLHAAVEIGRNVVVNDGVTLITGTHDVGSEVFKQIGKPIKIHDYAWVCTGAMLLPGVTIGEGAVVAAGAVVSRDVAPYTVVAGNPARVVKQRPQVKFIYRPAEFRACVEAWIEKPW